MKKIFSTLVFMFIGMLTFAQTTISGTVKDVDGLPLSDANITIVGKSLGTNSDFDGLFSLQVSQNPPFTVEVSLLGFETKTFEITKNEQVIDVVISENETSLDEVVISASRTPERIIESPVTIERLDSRAIKNTSSATFYDGLENLKGVDVNTNSLSFKSVNTRGFATFSNTRFMQLVDGMDNSSPALNFSLGNLLGMNELDVNTVELLPGASSALYGANAFNGILFMTSKSPFKKQGASLYLKSGITAQDAAGNNQFYDVGARFAHAFSEKVAVKASIGYLQGVDWYATDYRNVVNQNTLDNQTRVDPGYNGLNVYGDEVAQNIEVLAGLPAGSLGTKPIVSRTGYNEVDLMNYDVKSVKLDAALHYKPFADDFEIIYNAKIGHGNTIYQGSNRYSLTNFFMQQHKLEFRADNFFVRGYITSESAGDSYDTRFAAININRKWKSDRAWFGDYIPTYIGAYTGAVPGITAGDQDAAHAFARNIADMGRYEPGSTAFKNAFEQVKSDGDLTTGAKFTDRSKITHGDANYNFKDKIKFAEVQVGGSARQYSLNSAGTIYTDYNGPITYLEYGVYTQLQKKLADDRLKITASVRYDKAEQFDGNFSPRVSLAYAAGEDKQHNFRGSFQTGFRNPTTQDLFIGLDAGAAYLVGGSPENLNRYNTTPITANNPTLAGGATVVLNGSQAYDNAFSIASIAAGTPAKATTDFVQPEEVQAYELGYRGKLGKFTVDLSGYYNAYTGFIANKNVIVPLYGTVGDNSLSLLALANDDYKVFQTYTNSPADVNSYGAAIGVDTRLGGGYKLGANYTYAKLDFDQATAPDFDAQFNTPEHKVKVSFGNSKVIDNLGFNINYRWSDKYLWQSSFQNGMIPARTVIDAQVNYSVPKWKSVFKIGGANIGGKEYVSAPGAGSVGSQYFASWTINP